MPTVLSLVRQFAPPRSGNLTHLQGQTTKPSRIILQQKGVVLSMRRNVKKLLSKNKHLRNNQVLRLVFVTLLNINSVYEVSCHCHETIPSKTATADDIVYSLWKTSKAPVETLWNQ